jgi:hypothetical protein
MKKLIIFIVFLFCAGVAFGAEKKITDLTALTTTATGDLVPIVDVSDTTDVATGATKKVAMSDLLTFDSDLSLLAIGANPQFLNALAQAPSTPQQGVSYIENGLDWDTAVSKKTRGAVTTIAFVEGEAGADTITDSDSGFLTAGFADHMRIKVSGSISNDGYYTIDTVVAGTITLVTTDELTAENAGQAVTILANFRYEVFFDQDNYNPSGRNEQGDFSVSGIDYGTVLTVDGAYFGDTLTMTVDSGIGSSAFGQAYHIDTDGELIDADADADTTAPVIGLAVETGTGAKSILLKGIICETDWNWTIGGIIYLSTDPTTTTGLTQTPVSGAGDQSQILGIALSADTILFTPSTVLIEVGS